MQKIMFNDRYGLTKAVIDGKKTQTRRPFSKADMKVLEEINLKPEDKSLMQYIIDSYSRYKVGETVAVAQSYETIYKAMSELPEEEFEHPRFHIKNIDNLIKEARSTKVKDILDAVDRQLGRNKKDLQIKGEKDAIVKSKSYKNFFIDNYYNAMYCSEENKAGWKNKMFVKAEFMPRQIRITDIRLERLQDISDEDCLAEGIRRWADEKEYASNNTIRKSVDELKAAGYDAYAIPECWSCFASPRAAYAALIDKVSGKGTWEKNPWVFVYEFELVK